MTEKEKLKISKTMYVLREICAVLLWLYIICKIFIFDIDNYIIATYFPTVAYILYYKLAIFAALISVFWLIVGKKRFPLFFMYVSAYPLIIIFWKIPKYVYNKWEILIVFAPAIYELVTKFRFKFIFSTVAFLSVICITLFQDKIVLIFSMCCLFCYLAYQVYSGFNRAYQSTFFFQFGEVLTQLKTKWQDNKFAKGIFNKDSSDEQEKEKVETNRSTQMSTFYICFCLSEIIKNKISNVQQSGKIDLYLVASWFRIVFIAIFIYSFEYYSLFKIHQEAFAIQIEPTYFSFLGFSIGVLTFSGLSNINPVSTIASLIYYSEVMSALVILIILIFTILTAARERYKEDVANMEVTMRELGSTIKSDCNTIFNMALADLEYTLLTENEKLVNWLRKARGLTPLQSPNTDEQGDGSDQIIDVENKDVSGTKKENGNT
jgi:hypothetical protein